MLLNYDVIKYHMSAWLHLEVMSQNMVQFSDSYMRHPSSHKGMESAVFENNLHFFRTEKKSTLVYFH